MKKQINPTIKAHLVRSGFYLLLLLAVCAIPFALAQRNTTKRSMAPQPGVTAKMYVSAFAPATSIAAAAQSQVRQISGNDQSQLPKVSSGHTGVRLSIVPQPKLPQVVLYDQYNNAGTNATVSQDFETVNDPFDNQLADDFVVPAGPSWTVNEVDVQGVYFNGPGPAASFNVFFYQDSGTLPGTNVYTATGLAYSGNPGPNFVIPLTVPAVLPPGT